MPTSPLRQRQLLRDFNRVDDGPNADFLRDYGYDRATGIYGAYADPNADTTLQPGDPTPAVQPLPLPSATPTPTPAPTARPQPTVAPRLPVSQGGGSIAFLPLLPRTPVRSGLLSSTYSPEELAAYNAAHAHLLEGTTPTSPVLVNGRPVPTRQPAPVALRPGATAADPSAGGRYGEAGQNYGMTSQQANALLAWSQRPGGDQPLSPDEIGYTGNYFDTHEPAPRGALAAYAGRSRQVPFRNAADVVRRSGMNPASLQGLYGHSRG